MTPDTTHTEAVAAHPDGETDDLTALVERARVVVWDFDGPICRLFAGHKAEGVARDLVSWLEGRGLHSLLDEAERESLDPHVVLRAVNRRHPGSDLVAELEERLTQEELRAAASAMPTAYADVLIHTWAEIGARLAVATNNAPRVVRTYLTDRRLLHRFQPHIYGRTQDLQYLKPHPHYLNRALSAMGAAPGSALFIGDTPTDWQAAAEAGVPFLGYARTEEKEKLLCRAGADHVVTDLNEVLRAVRAAGAPG
ncbi:HAD family hydrolase [Streptomyces sp. NPDC003514]